MGRSYSYWLGVEALTACCIVSVFVMHVVGIVVGLFVSLPFLSGVEREGQSVSLISIAGSLLCRASGEQQQSLTVHVGWKSREPSMPECALNSSERAKHRGPSSAVTERGGEQGSGNVVPREDCGFCFSAPFLPCSVIDRPAVHAFPLLKTQFTAVQKCRCRCQARPYPRCKHRRVVHCR